MLKWFLPSIAVGLVAFSSASPAFSAVCDELRIVLPKKNGGTVYLGEKLAPLTGRHPYAGYIPVGTLLTAKTPENAPGTKAYKECGGDPEFARCITNQSGAIESYLLTTSSYGSVGWVKQSDAPRLQEWLKKRTDLEGCQPGRTLFVPIGATSNDSIKIYGVVERAGHTFRSDKPLKEPTRTNPMAVFLTNEDAKFVNLRLPGSDMTDERPAYRKVDWFDTRDDGKIIPKVGYVAAKDLGTAYRLAEIPSAPYRPIGAVADDIVETVANYLTTFFKTVDLNQLKTALQQVCPPIDSTVKAESPSFGDVLPLKFSANLIEFPKLRAYEARTVEGIFDNAKNRIFKIKDCKEQMGVALQTFETETLSISDVISRPADEQPVKTPVTIFQSELIARFKDRFTPPPASGGQVARAYMLQRSSGSASTSDPFSAYQTLYGWLKAKLDGQMALSEAEEDRFIQFLVNEILDPNPAI